MWYVMGNGGMYARLLVAPVRHMVGLRSINSTCSVFERFGRGFECWECMSCKSSYLEITSHVNSLRVYYTRIYSLTI